MGPLNHCVQAIPPAELTALKWFLHFALDVPNLLFHTDCEWVLLGFHRGQAETTGGCHVHADIWTEVWRLTRRRKCPILVKKVKAHSTLQMVDDQTVNPMDREGKGPADAAAKAALALHRINFDLVNWCRAQEAGLKMVARFLAFMQGVIADADDDAPKLDRRKKKSCRRQSTY